MSRVSNEERKMDSSDDSIPVNRSPHRRSTASVRDESSQGKGVGDRKGEEHRAVVVMLMVVVLVVVFVAFVVVVVRVRRERKEEERTWN